MAVSSCHHTEAHVNTKEYSIGALNRVGVLSEQAASDRNDVRSVELLVQCTGLASIHHEENFVVSGKNCMSVRQQMHTHKKRTHCRLPLDSLLSNNTRVCQQTGTRNRF